LQKADWRLPPYLGAKGVVLLFAGTIAAGVVIGGHGRDVVAAATAWSGLGIDAVRITGQSRTQEVAILDKLQIGQFPSLLTFDLDAAKARIETLPWVADVTLRKIYPRDLNIVIRERQPFALWQDGDQVQVIDETGHPIADASDDAYAGLPMVVGEGAGARVGEFTALMAAAPSIAAHVRAGVLVGGRRWTVVMDTGVELMLPETDPTTALATVVQLDASSALLSRAIAAVDLRVAGHTVVRLDADGMAARTAWLKTQNKKAKT
jgi:cell division protein FtsQ